jgi:hypothetical protein
MKLKLIIFSMVILCPNVFAQPRPVEPVRPSNSEIQKIKARYEGGMFGYGKKQDGFLRVDDENKRLVFLNGKDKEVFSLPYSALLLLYPSSQSVTSAAGNVIRHIPLPGAGLAGYIREERRYMVVQFSDPDVAASGAASFRIDDKDTLALLMRTIASKAGLTQRGDSYYRARN